MTNMRNLTLTLVGISCFTANAQYEPDTLKPLPLVTDVFVMPGTQLERFTAGGLEQWRTLVPKSELLAGVLSDHKNSFGSGGFNTSDLFAVSASFRLGGKNREKRSGAYLRAGFAYSEHYGNDLFLSMETRTPYDTLTSAQTGAVVLVDSVTTSTYYAEHQYSQIALDASVIFLRQYPKRWSLYGGAGLQVGRAFGGTASISHHIRHTVDPRITSNGSSSAAYGYSPSEREELRTKDDLTVALYAPLGITYRLGKKRAFWRAMNLCYELRPTLAFGGVPELGTVARAAIGHLFGLRVDLVE